MKIYQSWKDVFQKVLHKRVSIEVMQPKLNGCNPKSKGALKSIYRVKEW